MYLFSGIYFLTLIRLLSPPSTFVKESSSGLTGHARFCNAVLNSSLLIPRYLTVVLRDECPKALDIIAGFTLSSSQCVAELCLS